MAYTVFDGVAKFTADSSDLDSFIVKLEQGLSTASEKAAASTRELKEAQDEFRAAIKAVNAEGGDTAENLQRLAEAEKNLALAAAAAKQEHANLKDSLGVTKQALDSARQSTEGAGYSMMEARHGVMLLGEEVGVHIPRAVATLIASIGPLGGILATAFPALAVVALIAAIGKAIEIEAKHEEALRKIAQAQQDLSAKENESAQSLEASNLKLDDQIAKLEGRPETNKLAAALLDSQVASERMSTALLDALRKNDEALDVATGKSHNFWEALKITGLGLADVAAGAVTAGGALVVFGSAAKAEFDDQVKLQHALKGVENAENAARQARDAKESFRPTGNAKKDEEELTELINKERNAWNDVALASVNALDTVHALGITDTAVLGALTQNVTQARSAVRQLGDDHARVIKEMEKAEDELRQEHARTAEALSNVKITGTEKLSILDAAKIQQDGEQAYAAETAAIKKLVDADVLGGQMREQAELNLIPRMEAAEKALNDAKLAALDAGHKARLVALEAEQAEILKYEVGDAQLKALRENDYKKQEENKKYQTDREKLVDDGEKQVQAIEEKGAADRIALQKQFHQALQALAKSQDALDAASAKDREAQIALADAAQENSIKQLASMKVITAEQERARLLAIYQQEEEDALAVLRDQQQKMAVDGAKGISLFGPKQLADLQQNLKAAEGDVDRSIAVIKASFAAIEKANPYLTEAQLADLHAKENQLLASFINTQSQITKEQEKFEKERLAQEKDSYALSVVALQSYQSAKLQSMNADLRQIEVEIQLAKSRGQDVAELEKKRAALQAAVAAQQQQETHTKQEMLLMLQAQQADLEATQRKIALLQATKNLTEEQQKEIAGLKAHEKEVQNDINASNKMVLAYTHVRTAAQAVAAGASGWKAYFDAITSGSLTGTQALAAFAMEVDQAMASSVEAALTGSEGFGQAMAKMLRSLLAMLVGEAMVKIPEEYAKAASDTADYNYAGAAMHIAAAHLWEVLGGVGLGGSIAMSAAGVGGSGSGSSSKSTTSSSAPSASTTSAGTSSPNPIGTVNVEHFATGTVALGPTLAVIGDSESGGSQKEAVLPLENQRAMNMIADALIPALLYAMAKRQGMPEIPSFFDGALVSSPMLAMIGDNSAGGAATEGVLPLDNSTAMSRIAESILGNMPKYQPGASSALLSPSMLASVGSAIERSLEIRSTAEVGSRANSTTDVQAIATAFAKALDGKTPMGGEIKIQLESDIPQLVKRINHSVSTGRSRLLASNSIRVTKRS